MDAQELVAVAALLNRAAGRRMSSLVIDVTGDVDAWAAWWAANADVIGVAPVLPGYLLPGVVGLAGDVRDPATVRRVVDQVAGRDVTAVIVAHEDPAGALYRPLLHKDGLMLVRRETASGVTYGVVEGAADHG